MLPVVLLACLSGPPQQSVPSAAAVLAAARTGTQDGLLVVAREHADTLREAFAQSLRLSLLASSPTEQRTHMTAARRLARAYATAWNDPFLVRDVERFERFPLRAQLARVRADSLRKAGNHALGRDGVPAAMRLWRRSLDVALSARDSTGQAVSLGNLGAGFYRDGQTDSATAYLMRSRQLALALGDRRTTANAMGVLASVHKDLGELAQAADLYVAASALREQSGDGRGVAADQNNLGLIAIELGDFAAAARAFERALALNTAGGRDAPRALNLSNLAAVSSLLGEYARADQLFGEALRLQSHVGEDAERAFTVHERALLRIRRGDLVGAEADLRTALEAHEASGAGVEAALVHSDLASVLMAQGDAQGALSSLRDADRAAAASAAPLSVLADIAVAHADMAIELNDYRDASERYADAERWYRSDGDDFGLGRVADGRALLLDRRDDDAGALASLSAAAQAYARAGDTRSTALARLSMAYTQIELADTIGARSSLEDAAGTLRDLGDPVAEAGTLHASGDLAMARRTPIAAERFYRAGIETLGDLPASAIRWRLYAGLGAALRAQQAMGPAVQALRAAVDEIERSAATLVAPERRVGYMADKYEVYGQLALAERALGDGESALITSERMRARHMLAMLGRGRLSGRRPLVAREQDLRRQISELMESLDEPPEALGARESESARRADGATREALYDAQTRYARLLTELREQEPAYASVVAPASISVAAVSRHLRRDEVMVEYLVTDSASIAFIIADGIVSVVDLGISRRALAQLADFAVRVTQRSDTVAGGLWRAPLARLYDHLIAPLQATGRLSGKRALVVVPHAELHSVPFAALVAGESGAFLVSEWDISYAASASVWLRQRQSSAERRPGVLALAPRTDVLPFSGEEVAGIERIYGRNATTLVGAAVSEEALRAALPRSGTVHLATLGVLNRHNPLFSFIDLGGPAGRRERLEVHEIFDLSLDGQLVVLSACQTGLGAGALADVPPGDDWVGLMQAFLSAGAGAVVASLWPVSDRATAGLMIGFHRRIMAGRNEAGALADAQREALGRAATAHPYFWAAFTVHSGQ